MWGHSRFVLGAIGSFLEPFRRRLSPNIDNVSEKNDFEIPPRRALGGKGMPTDMQTGRSTHKWTDILRILGMLGDIRLWFCLCQLGPVCRQRLAVALKRFRAKSMKA